MRTALILGASSDIGLATCRRYMAAGWRVIGHFRTPNPKLDALAGPVFEPWQADFAETDKLEAALRDNSAFFTRADALINLAAEIRPVRFEACTASDMLSAFSVNVIPALLMMRTVGSQMAARGFGRIVHASSIGVTFGGGSDNFSYSFSKHALEFIPRASRQWAANNVLVNVLRVGVTDTKAHTKFPSRNLQERTQMIPAKRRATAGEIAETLYWFGSEANGFTTGQLVSVAGGE